MAYMLDATRGGRRFRLLRVNDTCSRKGLANVADRSLGERVVRVLDRLVETRARPQTIQVDNGPEFRSKILDS